MTKLLLTQYRLEFEHTDITINDLIDKYSIDLEDLKGWELWTKEGGDIVTVDTPTDIIVPPKLDIVPHKQDTTIEDQVLEFKEKAMKHCLDFMNKDVRFAEVKEFKDIVSIVDSIDKSLQKKGSGDDSTNINILVQNITERFKDDC